MPKVSIEALRNFFANEFPQTSVTIEETGPGYCRVRQEITQAHLRPGKTVSGPVMIWVVDCATYGAILTEIGLIPLAVTTNISMNFLRKPTAERAILGEARLLKLGKRLAVAEAKVFAEGKEQLLAHATLTYSIPPKSTGRNPVGE